MPITIHDLDDELIVDVVDRAKRRINRIQESLHKISKGNGLATETPQRLDRFELREKQLGGTATALAHEMDFGLERKIGKSNDLLSFEFLEQGMIAGFSVGLVEIEALDKVGTGFFVAPNIVLTNHHVVGSVAEARAGRITLGFEDDRIKTAPGSIKETFQFDPDSFYLADEGLDYAFIAVDTSITAENISWLPLIEEIGKIAKSHPVNVIQHPDERPKQVVVHNSHLLDIEDNGPEDQYCWYTSDTEPGSSGSPVFNNRWEVIALHHKAIPKVNKNNEILDVNGRTMAKERYKQEPHMVQWFANEGVRVSRIVASFKALDCSVEHAVVRTRILALWNKPGARRVGLRTTWLE